MSIENQKNRDLFLKICFMYFLNNILNVLDIDEEIDDILPTELITVDKKGRLKIFDDLQDFRVSTKQVKSSYSSSKRIHLEVMIYNNCTTITKELIVKKKQP